MKSNALSLLAATTLLLGGCSPHVVAEPSEDDVEIQAHRQDVLAAVRDDAEAWQFFSIRCQERIGSVANYSKILDAAFAGRKPDYEVAIAHAEGKYARVVSVDRDPNAPASALRPRMWKWQGVWKLDSC